MALMSDEDYREIRDMTELLRHYRALIGYTRESVRKAVREIREDYRYEESVIGEMMRQRADELERHLEAISEATG